MQMLPWIAVLAVVFVAVAVLGFVMPGPRNVARPAAFPAAWALTARPPAEHRRAAIARAAERGHRARAAARARPGAHAARSARLAVQHGCHAARRAHRPVAGLHLLPGLVLRPRQPARRPQFRFRFA